MGQENSPQDQKKQAEQSAMAGVALGFLLLFMVVVGGIFLNVIANFDAGERPQKKGQVIERRMTSLNGKDLETGLKIGPGWETVRANCLSCHSSKLIVQNRMSRESWEKSIRWMQKTQGLADLHDNEPIILDYLGTFYAPSNKGRRKNLENIEWYVLEQ
jgi:hypothetical protein